jgi:VCBS repeat-containing protein
VLANDTDVENDPLTARLVSAPSHGTLTLNADGSFTYTPNLYYSGGDSFTYVANDVIADSNIATVNLTITPVNHAPDCSLAVPDTAWLWPPNNKFNAVKILGVTDVDGDPITIIIDGVYQDELVGTGNSAPDATGIGTDAVSLRAERDGSGNGRVYHIFFTASDGQGGTCKVDITSPIMVRVAVSHDQGGGINPIDGGALYDSTKPTL